MFSVAGKREAAHSEAIWCCCWPRIELLDQDLLITGSLDNEVKTWIWDDLNLNHQDSLEPHQLGVISIDASPDGSKILTSSLECCLKLYQTADRAKLAEIDAGPVDSWTACFLSESAAVVSGDNNNNNNQGLLLGENENQNGVNNNSNSVVATKILTGAQNGKINIFDTETLTKKASLKAGEKFIMSVAASPDGHLLAGASQEGIIYVFDTETLSLLHSIEAHAMPVRKIKFNSDGKLLFSAADDKYAKVHNIAASVSLVATFPGHSSSVTSLDLSPMLDNDNCTTKQFVTCSADRTVRVWDLGQRQTLHKFTDHSDQVWDVAYNHNGSRLASVSEDKSIIIYNIPI